MAGGGRVGGIGYAERVNAAAELVEAGVPVADAAQVLAGRFAVSVRQARRYVDQAVAAGRGDVPHESVVFTVKLPAALARRVRAHARENETTISAVVVRALTEFLQRGRREPPRRGATGQSGRSSSLTATRPRICRWPTPFSCHSGGPVSGPARKEGRPVTSAAIYARVSSARQKKDETIGSQTAALRDHARQLGAELPEEWVFEDEGHSGATLVRPALERLRDVVAGVGVDVVLCYSPDRLARKFAYQALLIEEFARAGTRVEFIKGPRGDSPEDQLMVQFQGMFAEYEKAQLMERYRRGKAYRARSGSVNVLGGAPFGYRYLSKSPGSGAGYEIAEHEAALAAEMFRRYADDGASIADLARWLTSENVPTRTGKARWDRSVIWGMLRNPAYAGTAVFGKTMVVQESPGLNRRARLEGRTTPRSSKTVDRPRGGWIEIPVPAIVTAETFERAARRLEDNKRFASRNSKIPSLLQGLASCSACGFGYYRTSTRTTNKKIYYSRCLGSDDSRYQGGRVCGNKPVRADYLDTVVWDHITHLLADPALIRAEISKRLQQARTADPATRQRKRLELALAKATTAITRMIEAFQEQLITIDELRSRMPDLRARETNLRGQLEALDAQLADQEAYLKLADDLEGFLTQLQASTSAASVPDRQRVLRLLVKDVLVGPEKITIRHRIPIRERTSHSNQEHQTPDTEGDQSASCPLRWGRDLAAARQHRVVGAG